MKTDFIYMNVFASTLRGIIKDFEDQIDDFQKGEIDEYDKPHIEELESELSKAKKIYKEYYI